LQHKDALEKALRSIIEITRNAPGCVQCDLHSSLEYKLVFFLDQLWVSEDDWNNYKQRKHMQEFFTLSESMIDTIDVCILEH